MRCLVLLLLAPLLLLTVPAAQADNYQQNLATLRKFTAGDPDKLARRNARAGDYRFLALRGYTRVVPGLNRGNCQLAESDWRYLPGSSEDMWDSAHTRLGDKAYHFAERYNTTMIRQRGVARRPVCG